jgi:hypothetical protein
VYHPLLSEALVKFQSETMMSTFPAAGPVKTQIIGKETTEKKESAKRVQLRYELPIDRRDERVPPGARKNALGARVFPAMRLKRSTLILILSAKSPLFVPAEDIVVPYGASDLESAERVTHVMRKTENELRKLQVSGFYMDIDLGEPNNTLDEVEKKIAEKMGFQASSDSRYKLLKCTLIWTWPGLSTKTKTTQLRVLRCLM